MLEKISVIIPIKNENNYIEESLKRILDQTYPKNKIEILVIDGISSDGTREIVKRLEDESLRMEDGGWRQEEKENQPQTSNLKPLSLIRLIDNPKGHRASALNIGIKEAKGDVIIRVDARTVIPPDYIEKCVKTLIETGADNVGGMQKPITALEDGGWMLEAGWVEVGGSRLEGKDIPQTSNLEPRTLTQMAVGIGLSHPFGVGNAQFRLGKKSGFVDTVYLGCFRKEIFDKVGLFDEESAVISEDSDMNYRIRQAGGRVYFNKDIIAYYYPRDNFKDLWKLYFRYGGAKAGNLLKRGKLTALRQIVPPIFLISLILLSLFSFFSKQFFYLWFYFIGSYFVIDFLFSLYLAFRNNGILEYISPEIILKMGEENIKREIKTGLKKISLFWRLMFVFPILHFSWALGFWRRLFQTSKPGKYWGY